MDTVQKYDALITSKIRKPLTLGFEVDALNPKLFAFQDWLVRWALRVGRCAMFMSAVWARQPMQLEWAWRVHLHTGGNVLILCPLAVVRADRARGLEVPGLL